MPNGCRSRNGDCSIKTTDRRSIESDFMRRKIMETGGADSQAVDHLVLIWRSLRGHRLGMWTTVLVKFLMARYPGETTALKEECRA